MVENPLAALGLRMQLRTGKPDGRDGGRGNKCIDREYAMILILDYDMGNIASIKNMLHAIGYDDVQISGNRKDIALADKIILPGVGAFDRGMENLAKKDLIGPVREAVLENGKTILGICLGMQLLGLDSEEGVREGLGLIPFHTKRFVLGDDYKVPHMGWTEVTIEQQDCPILKHVPEGPLRYYFVHSYHAVCDDPKNILMTAQYGYRFTAAVVKDNIYGAQFHPEKSHMFGKALMKGFVEL